MAETLHILYGRLSGDTASATDVAWWYRETNERGADMGFLDKLFGGQQSEPQPADPRLAAVFALPPDEPRYRKKDAEKALARESAAIMAILDSTGERCLIAAHNTWYGNRVIVVTDRRTFTLKQGKIERELRHEQVSETSMNPGTGRIGNTNVYIMNRENQLDYAPDDPNRFRDAITAEVGSYRIANAICGYIDQHLSS